MISLRKKDVEFHDILSSPEDVDDYLAFGEAIVRR